MRLPQLGDTKQSKYNARHLSQQLDMYWDTHVTDRITYWLFCQRCFFGVPYSDELKFASALHLISSTQIGSADKTADRVATQSWENIGCQVSHFQWFQSMTNLSVSIKILLFVHVCLKPFPETVSRGPACRCCFHCLILMPFSIYKMSKTTPVDNFCYSKVRTVITPNKIHLARPATRSNPSAPWNQIFIDSGPIFNGLFPQHNVEGLVSSWQ